jgi:hypothetical protein
MKDEGRKKMKMKSKGDGVGDESEEAEHPLLLPQPPQPHHPLHPPQLFVFILLPVLPAFILHRSSPAI